MTDEALNAMVEALRDVADHAGYVPHLHHTAATAITTLRAQLAEAQRLMRLERTIADKNADRADRAEAALAAQIEVDAEICDGMQSSTMYYEAHECANAIRDQPHDRTALDRMLTEAREKALREAAQACDWGDIYGDNAVRTILALIEKPNAR